MYITEEFFRTYIDTVNRNYEMVGRPERLKYGFFLRRETSNSPRVITLTLSLEKNGSSIDLIVKSMFGDDIERTRNALVMEAFLYLTTSSVSLLEKISREARKRIA